MEHTLTMAIDQSPAAATASFEALYRASADAVYAYASSLLRDRSAAEEVTATAFERAFRKQRSFNPRRGSQRAWLFGIARNAALDELRRRKRIAALADDPAADTHAPYGAGTGEPATEGEAEVAERRATVRAALAALEPRERELIALKFHAGLSNAEIGGVLGISASNAGTRVHRALTQLREACHAPS